MEIGFILKKLISIMILPMSIVLVVFLIGLIFLYKNKTSFSKVILTAAFVLLSLFSYSPVANSLINSLEQQYKKLEKVPNNVQYLLLLGGDFEQRAWEVLRLYSQNKNLKIITSGYEGNYEIPEATRSAGILQHIGIPKENIIIHPQPKDTKEEAIKIKEILSDKPFILVTVAHHMPRAMALFKKEGTNPIAAPSHFIGNKIKLFSIPNTGSLYKTQIALHEYIGLLWAKYRGQI